MITSQIFITSLNKSLNQAKINGDLNLKIIYLYYLYMYYIEFTNNKVEFEKENDHLKRLISELKYKYPNIICNYKIGSSFVNTSRVDNTAPTVSDNTIDIEGEFIYKFKIEDFTKNYFDAENDNYLKVMIVVDSEIADNQIYYINNSLSNPILVDGSIEIPYQDIDKLMFISKDIDANKAFNDSELNYTIKFRVSDDFIPNSLYSAIQTITLINSKYTVNYPPTIGDISIIADNNIITILTLDMFTNQMAPPYNDPEGDLIDAIRIDKISQSNGGIFYYDNNPIQIGDIITRADLQNGLFTHSGVNADTLAGDVIEFSARDEGSKIWVQ